MEKNIDVNVPMRTAYDQWIQFEDLRVRQLDDKHLFWHADKAGNRVEGDLKRFKGYIESRGQETGAWRNSWR